MTPHPRRAAVPAALVLLAASLLAGPADAVNDARTARAATVTIDVSRTSTPVGGEVVVTGTVTGAADGTGADPVALQTQLADGWRTLVTGTTDAAGRYSLRLPTEWYHAHALRVQSDETSVSPTRTVRVEPTYRPAGRSTDHELSSGDFRWNGCKPITWKFNQRGGFKGSLKVVKRAVLEVARGTGFTFSYRGSTSIVPVRDDGADVADLVIGWATPKEVPPLSGSTAGYAATSGTGPDVDTIEINEGAVALDRTASLAPAYAATGKVAWGQVMVHEVAHAVGLEHTSATDQLMAPTATTRNTRLGLGDLRAMELVGLAQGCWDQGAR